MNKKEYNLKIGWSLIKDLLKGETIKINEAFDNPKLQINLTLEKNLETNCCWSFEQKEERK